jgi:hypothetical protein
MLIVPIQPRASLVCQNLWTGRQNLGINSLYLQITLSQFVALVSLACLNLLTGWWNQKRWVFGTAYINDPGPQAFQVSSDRTSNVARFMFTSQPGSGPRVRLGTVTVQLQIMNCFESLAHHVPGLGVSP